MKKIRFGRIFRKTLFMSLMVLGAVSLTGCGGADTGSASASGSGSAAAASSTAKPSGRKALVVYYSASGNTERVAKDIAKAADADTMKLEPVKAYSSKDLDYRDQDSRVVKEHDDESLRDVALKKTKPDNWDQYDTVFIGYPIWWGIAAWPINGFIKGNDFSGKTVIPFCTSASSPIGDSGKLLQEMAGGKGSWQEGKRFASGASSDEVASWAKSVSRK